MGDVFGVAAASRPSSRNQFTKHYIPPGSGVLSVTIAADGPTRVLTIDDRGTPTRTPRSATPTHGSPAPRVRPPSSHAASPVHVPYADGAPAQASATSEPAPSHGWDVELKLQMDHGLGVSIVDTEELAYLSSQGINVLVHITAAYHSFRMSVGNLQIDNQLPHEDHQSAVLYPVRPARLPAPRPSQGAGVSSGVEAEPVFHVTVTRSRDCSVNATVLRLFEVGVRPLVLNLDERLMLRLMALVHAHAPVTTAARSGNASATRELATSLQHALDDQAVSTCR